MASRPAAPIVPMPWDIDAIHTKQQPTVSRSESITSADALDAASAAPTAWNNELNEADSAEERNEARAAEPIERSWAVEGSFPPQARASQPPSEAHPLATTHAQAGAGKASEGGGSKAEDSFLGKVCDELLPEAAMGLSSMDEEISSTPLLDLALTFRLQSNPGASKVIYLDFDSHTTTGTSWNNSTMGTTFYSPAYDIDGNAASYGDTELTRIQTIWQRVSSDFTPFDVNVTTLAPPDDWLARSGSTDPNYGVRVVITSYGPSSSFAAGISFVSSFTASTDTPVFVYNNSILGAAETISHEVGHSLGLSHDGSTIEGSTYYGGHGTGETSWAPIMGGAYSRSVTTWDDGSYAGSNNTGSAGNYGKGGSDLAVITGTNGISYRPDLVGNNATTAAQLAIANGTAAQYGTIETRLESDWFSFQLFDTGDVDLMCDPYWYQVHADNDGLWGGNTTSYQAPTRDILSTTPYPENTSNLDLAVELFNSGGLSLIRADDPGLAVHVVAKGLNAGTYYLKLDGVGFGDPSASTPTGYTDYASIGNYMISGTITSATDSTANPVITLALAPSSVFEDGSSNLVYTFSRSLVTANPLSVNFTVSGTATNGSDYSGLLAGSNQTVTFAANAATASLVIDPTADTSVEADETVGLMLGLGTG